VRGVRPEAVSGSFYPADPAELRATVEELLAAAPPPAGERPRALVAPHAGYVYSGPVAASAFRELVGDGSIERIVLLGPSHYVPLRGLALSPDRAFRTPLGEIEIDPGAGASLAGCPAVGVSAAPHAREHALEVELPFLQVTLGAFRLVPLVVGEASPAEVAGALARFDDDPGTRVVVSTDLSHYLDYAAAARRDAATARAILALDPGAIGEADACGRVPLRGLLERARERGWRARELDRRSSGDTAGGRDRVVGYGAYAFA
jgi:AmmeMemoRadiSam system protein B